MLLAALEGWRKRGGEVAEPERWFHGIILKHVRRWRQRRFVELTRSEQEEGAEEEAIDKTCNAEEFLMSEERRRLLYQLYDELPVDHLDAVIAREHDELPFEEIAVAFEKPVSTVYGYYTAGMKEVRAAFERWKAKQRDGGALLLPLTLDALFDADRHAPPEPLDEEDLERARRRARTTGRAKNRAKRSDTALRPAVWRASRAWAATTAARAPMENASSGARTIAAVPSVRSGEACIIPPVSRPTDHERACPRGAPCGEAARRP
jgi:DNA-directed RNA polymerase specialized sigma24 family protein